MKPYKILGILGVLAGIYFYQQSKSNSSKMVETEENVHLDNSESEEFADSAKVSSPLQNSTTSSSTTTTVREMDSLVALKDVIQMPSSNTSAQIIPSEAHSDESYVSEVSKLYGKISSIPMIEEIKRLKPYAGMIKPKKESMFFGGFEGFGITNGERIRVQLALGFTGNDAYDISKESCLFIATADKEESILREQLELLRTQEPGYLVIASVGKKYYLQIFQTSDSFPRTFKSLLTIAGQPEKIKIILKEKVSVTQRDCAPEEVSL